MLKKNDGKQIIFFSQIYHTAYCMMMTIYAFVCINCKRRILVFNVLRILLGIYCLRGQDISHVKKKEVPCHPPWNNFERFTGPCMRLYQQEMKRSRKSEKLG